MKKIIIGIAVVLIIGGMFSYRYFYIPKKINDNFISKLAVNDKLQQPDQQVEQNKEEKKSDTSVKNTGIVSDVNDKKIPEAKKIKNLLKNGGFKNNINGWGLWREAKKNPENVKVVDVENNYKISNAVIIENPNKKMIGISQIATLTSGTVYRLSGAVRSLGNDGSKIFGGRIAVYLPPQKERQIVWMSEHDKFWEQQLVFTNLVTGQATVYLHLGYGGVATTGEFANVRLEENN